ncbi:MAG: TIM barrel protein [Candidatus Pacearchaeota archaeon]
MTKIFFGPSSLGSYTEAFSNLEYFKKNGLSACEVAFTYGVYLDEKQAMEIGRKAKELGIGLSIHAPYYINLNSEDKRKIAASKKRILDCAKIGHFLGAKKIVFHSGFYGKISKEETFENIKKQILELNEEKRKNKWEIELCPEIMGKINVFGSIEEISKLSKETGCGFCIDFAHILARYKNSEFELIKKSFPRKEWHCHFSGIEYGEKGEKNHRKTKKEEWIELFNFLKDLNKEITIINESPTHIEDSIEGYNIWLSKN